MVRALFAMVVLVLDSSATASLLLLPNEARGAAGPPASAPCAPAKVAGAAVWKELAANIVAS